MNCLAFYYYVFASLVVLDFRLRREGASRPPQLVVTVYPQKYRGYGSKWLMPPTGGTGLEPGQGFQRP